MKDFFKFFKEEQLLKKILKGEGEKYSYKKNIVRFLFKDAMFPLRLGICLHFQQINPYLFSV